MWGTAVYCNTPNLLNERIWKIADKKKSIYLDRGVFHHKSEIKNAYLKNLRVYYSKKKKFERIVFDFGNKSISNVYGHISSTKNKIYVDVFNVKPRTDFQKITNGKFLKSVDIYSLDKNNITFELNFKGKFAYDIFHLKNPGRLVIDVKK
jgi:hypothetical protein